MSIWDYLVSPSAGSPLQWSMTCIWGMSGANIPTSASWRLRWTRTLWGISHAARGTSEKLM